MNSASIRLPTGTVAFGHEADTRVRTRVISRREDRCAAQAQAPSARRDAAHGAENACLRSSEPMDLDPLNLIGTAIDGKYDVDALIEATRLSLVYRAKHRVWRRPVAVKIFKTWPGLSEES